jgi:hypothetical protein
MALKSALDGTYQVFVGLPFYIILILCTGQSSDNCEIRLDSP